MGLNSNLYAYDSPYVHFHLPSNHGGDKWSRKHFWVSLGVGDNSRALKSCTFACLPMRNPGLITYYG